MRYAFIEEQRTQHCVRRMCDLLNVSPAGYLRVARASAQCAGDRRRVASDVALCERLRSSARPQRCLKVSVAFTPSCLQVSLAAMIG